MSRKDQPTFTVVVPLYNKAPFIERCMGTIRAQTFGDYEVIVVDDGSTDGSPENIASYLTGRDRLLTQPNAGCGPARNTGVAHSTSPYIAFLDADDEWHPEFLETMVRLLDQYPEAGMGACRYENRFANGSTYALPPVFGGGEGLIGDLLGLSAEYGNFVCHVSSVVVRRDVFEAVGGFGAGRGQDHDLWARIQLAGRPTAFTDRILGRWHRDVEGSITTRSPKCSLLVQTARDRLAGGDVPPSMVESLKKACASALGAYAYHLINAGMRREARDALREATALWPGLPCRRRLWLKSRLPRAATEWTKAARRRLRAGVRT